MATTRVDSDQRLSRQDHEPLADQVTIGPNDLIDLRSGRADVVRDGAAPTVDSLPSFPHMESLRLEHLDAIRMFTRAFDDYSDFNATSLWGWSAAAPGGYRIGSLHGNLVVEYGDYLTQQRFLSFLGVESPDETAAELHRYAVANNLDPTLRLVPGVTARLLDQRKWEVRANAAAADYVYAVGQAAKLKGKQYRSMRHAVNAWERRWASRSQVEWMTADALSDRKGEILDLFDEWRQRGSAGSGCSAHERVAIETLLERAPEVAPQLSGWSGLCISDGRLAAVFLNERERHDQLAGHFFKMTDRECGNQLFTWYFVQLCRRANADGITFLNIQQDLGIPSLRAAKQQLRPHSLLAKYDVAPRE